MPIIYLGCRWWLPSSSQKTLWDLQRPSTTSDGRQIMQLDVLLMNGTCLDPLHYMRKTRVTVYCWVEIQTQPRQVWRWVEILLKPKLSRKHTGLAVMIPISCTGFVYLTLWQLNKDMQQVIPSLFFFFGLEAVWRFDLMTTSKLNSSP